MEILVAGGSGFLGAEITRVLAAGGHAVTVMSRSAPVAPIPGTSWVQGDVTDPESLVIPVSGKDIVVDAVQVPNYPMEDPKRGYTFERIDFGGTKNLVDAAKAGGVRQFIGLSGMGAAEDAPYHWLRFKWQEEQYIAAAGIPFTIFRPSWIYGARDVSLNRFLGFARWLPFVPVVGDGKMRINPLYVGDLAAHVLAAVANERAMGQVFELGGPQVMTMDDIIRTALRVTGKRRFLFHQPKPLMKAVATLVQHVPGRPLTPDAIEFVTMEGVADTALAESVFGLRLTSLDEALRQYL